MARLARVIATGVAHHVTQRGNARRTVFETDNDRLVYLSLLSGFSRKRRLTILGYCLMPNHVHLIVIPAFPGSMPIALREIHGRYAAYLNARKASTGHLWQGRYYSCPMDEDHLWTALRYVERNPVRAGMLVHAEQYPWSSARVHCEGGLPDGITDVAEWQGRWHPQEWREFLAWNPGDESDSERLRTSTHSGRPLGSEAFVRALEHDTGRILTPGKGGRPRKAAVETVEECRMLGPEAD